jgi:VIT1/CCC1 family predicted Fe2+/Mn2+ transporter
VTPVATRNDTDNQLRERPIGEVAKELTTDLSLLMRQEIELAKAEMTQKGRTAAPGLGMLGGASIVALCAAGAITAFLVLVFSLFLPDWAAALIVGAVLAAVTYVLVRQGKERVAGAGKPVPEQTIETVKEDVEWAKTRASSARK